MNTGRHSSVRELGDKWQRYELGGPVKILGQSRPREINQGILFIAVVLVLLLCTISIPAHVLRCPFVVAMLCYTLLM